MNNANSVKEQILDLARLHGVDANPTPIDLMAQAITRLAGDDAEQDDVELTLVHLAQQGHLTTEQSLGFMMNYLDERAPELDS